ncbi:MAG: hypothetical protein HC886_23465 [Leptolyngbyaceae cyanobacterium SM1_1_3]|nr:hypothetical protein [Leptolyngbyaceae cyanobacterium SM1_1_3]NJN03143.1 hypothetical protein [Leptolyngbyaceae cyanobacterium RM1_1_2]NJO09176.1 hypothetical protein [Leptolyngbyaceae cyanobacterium SL_1_1]
MAFQRVQPSGFQNPQTSSGFSQFASRPFLEQQPKRPPTQQELEQQVFNQDKFEAAGLQLKQKHGAITPIEQARLGMLQAKMDNFWAQRLERAKDQPNLLEILIGNSSSRGSRRRDSGCWSAHCSGRSTRNRWHITCCSCSNCTDCGRDRGDYRILRHN